MALVSSSVSQEGRAVLHAQSWFAAESDLVRHDHVPRHRYGHPDDHPPISAYALKDPPRPFWNNFDRRPLDFVEDWSSFPGSEPVWAEWLRFTVPQFDDRVVEACRLILLADLPSFPVAARAHPRDSHTWIAPSLDLAVQFHRLDALGEWLLVRGTAPIAERGLIGFRSEVWERDRPPRRRGRRHDGAFVASASSQLLSPQT